MFFNDFCDIGRRRAKDFIVSVKFVDKNGFAGFTVSYMNFKLEEFVLNLRNLEERNNIVLTEIKLVKPLVKTFCQIVAAHHCALFKVFNHISTGFNILELVRLDSEEFINNIIQIVINKVTDEVFRFFAGNKEVFRQIFFKLVDYACQSLVCDNRLVNNSEHIPAGFNGRDEIEFFNQFENEIG